MSGNHVEVIIDNQPVRALVDSGASFSVISEEYRRQLRKIMFSDSRNIVLKVADGKYVQPVGKCIVRLKINGRSQPFEFIVLSQCSHDVILGWDFLETSQAVIDCGRSELLLEELMPKASEESLHQDSLRLSSVQDCIVPAGTMAKIVVSGMENYKTIEVIVECNKTLTLEKDLIIPSSIITFENGRGELWVANAFTEPRNIP